MVRYFALPASQITGYRAMLVPDNDVLPVSNLKVVVYPNPVDDGRIIVKAELPGYLIKAMTDATDLEDPLTIEGVVALGIGGSYAGETREDVLAMFPELDGQQVIGQDEAGVDILVDIFPRKKWAFEV